MDGVGRLGLSAVVVVLALMAVAVSDLDARPDGPPSSPPASQTDGPTGGAVDDLVAAFARSRTATYRATGSFERTAPDGARLGAEVEIVQRRPDRLLRQFGEVQGRRGDRPLVCPAPAGGGRLECDLGPPGPSFDEVVADEVAAFRALVSGPDPLYVVRRSGDGCWRMVRTRDDPRSGYGMEAELCIDAPSGAMRSITIDHGRVDERTVYTDISTEVADDDLEP